MLLMVVNGMNCMPFPVSFKRDNPVDLVHQHHLFLCTVSIEIGVIHTRFNLYPLNKLCWFIASFDCEVLEWTKRNGRIKVVMWKRRMWRRVSKETKVVCTWMKGMKLGRMECDLYCVLEECLKFVFFPSFNFKKFNL